MLKTLEQHDEEKRALYKRYEDEMRNGRLNGIACPKCGAELYDTNPRITLPSNPAKKHIDCRADGCDYRGYRIA